LEELGGPGFDPGFGSAVEKNDDKGKPEPTKTMGESHEVNEIKEVNEVKEEEDVFARWEMPRIPAHRLGVRWIIRSRHREAC
jgi:hypothetical protein